MAKIPFHLSGAGYVRSQVLDAVDKLVPLLKDKPGGLASDTAWGKAYIISQGWQERLLTALSQDIPDWDCFAAFRCVIDFRPPEKGVTLGANTHFPPANGTDDPAAVERVRKTKEVRTLDEAVAIYVHYLRKKRDFDQTKPTLRVEAEDAFRERLNDLEAMPGGQASNALWLWRILHRKTGAFAFYPYKRLATQFQIHSQLHPAETQLLRFIPDHAWKPASREYDDGAPFGASVVAFEKGRRLIYQFKGLRDWDAEAGRASSWETVVYWYGDQEMGRIEQTDRLAGTWPIVPLFGSYEIVERELHILLAAPQEVKKAFSGRLTTGLVGGIDAIYYDLWLSDEEEQKQLKRLEEADEAQKAVLVKRIQDKRRLRNRLERVIVEQLRAMKEEGVRIGVELSGLPMQSYALLLQRLCRDKIVKAVCLNGEEDLAPIVGGEDERVSALGGLWLDPQRFAGFEAGRLQRELERTSDRALDLNNINDPERRFELATYLRARALAGWLGVDTLYVHTTILDMVLRQRDAQDDPGPGPLLYARQASIMAKGLVIVALLMRDYGTKWEEHLPDMTPALKPEGMQALARLARDLTAWSGNPAAYDRLLTEGYWWPPGGDDYALAAIPVVWPAHNKLPARLNPTGAGDMTAAAFLFLSGV